MTPLFVRCLALVLVCTLGSACQLVRPEGRAIRPPAELRHWRLGGLETAGPEAGVFEVTAAEATFAGVPAATSASSNFVVLENIGYVVGYSETRRNPLWAAYRLFPVTNPVRHDRQSHFTIDERTQAQVNHDCYTNQGYDRGHNAPNSAIDTRYGEDAQKETFVMSNVSPQLCGNNREPWQGFEHIVGETYASQYPEVFVVNGPIFDDTPETIDCDVQVPIGFYKIVVEAQSSAAPRVLALVMAQEDAGWFHHVRDFVTTVDCIEQLTELDFFSSLPDAVEAQVEGAAPDGDWEIDTVTRPTTPYGCPGEQDVGAGNTNRAALLAACGH